jgi:hypothetical protein
MNEPSSALRTATITRAARAIEAAKLQVIDRDWQSGEQLPCPRSGAMR